MRLPAIEGTIRRRILANYRVDADVAARLIPAPLEPLLHDGHAIAGICLIRLEGIRPSFLPSWTGLSSENVAHRFAVTWMENGTAKTGVYVPRRDTDSCLNVLAGDRLFPGKQHHARFESVDDRFSLSLDVQSADRKVAIHVAGHTTDFLPEDSIFPTVESSSAFFEKGAVGWSPSKPSAPLDGMELRVPAWRALPFAVKEIRSSYFDDEKLFPVGSAAFDHALIMRDVAHSWHGLGPCCAEPISAAAGV